jgi:hypothetical protein
MRTNPQACYRAGVSSRYLHPLACRAPRAFCMAVVAAARRREMSVSAFIKEALRRHLDSVDVGVNMPADSRAPNSSVWLGRSAPTRLAPLHQSRVNRAVSNRDRIRGGFKDKLT